MGKIILYLVVTCVIPLFSDGKHNSARDRRNIARERGHDLNIQNIQTPTTGSNSDRGFSNLDSSKQKDGYMNPISNATSRNNAENKGPSGLLELFKSSAQQYLDGKDLIHASGNTAKDERYTTNSITSFQYKSIQTTKVGDETSGTDSLSINKRFNGDFRNNFEIRFRNWYYRRYKYFDILASSILRK